MINKEILKKAQKIMLEELVEIDRICKKYEISYWIDGGTLLGAKRHRGFIPWDDDVDICMLGSDYKKLKKIIKNELSEQFFFQNKETDKNYLVPWSKIRHRNSLFIEKSHGENKLFHQGINMDIFIMDSYNSLKIMKVFRSLYKIEGLNDKNGNYLVIKKIILKLKLNKLVLKTLKFMLSLIKRKENNLIGYRYNFLQVYDYKDIFPLSEIEFEGYKFSCPNNIDAVLKELYGDTYMELPPEKDRVWHTKEIKLNEKCFFEKELERTGRNIYE